MFKPVTHQCYRHFLYKYIGETMKKIAVIGFGVTGISAVKYLLSLGIKINQIDVFSKDVGGEYNKGGLKYILHTFNTEKFFDDVIKMDYVIERVNGAVFVGGFVHPFPEFFWYEREIGDEIQKRYWLKTRKSLDGFDTGCMNEPWNYKNQLKIVPDGDFIQSMVNDIWNANQYIVKKQPIDSEVLAEMINKYDLIIYTIPIHPLFNLLGIDSGKQEHYESAKLTIQRFQINKHKPFWFEYLYVPSFDYSFHRMDFKPSFIDVEINDSSDDYSQLHQQVSKIVNTLSHGKVNVLHNTNPSMTINIKGQIKYDLTDYQILEKIPNNVVLLGRYAEWNKRVTWDKVVSRLFSYKKLFETFVY